MNKKLRTRTRGGTSLSDRISCSCPTSGNPVRSHEKGREGRDCYYDKR